MSLILFILNLSHLKYSATTTHLLVITGETADKVCNLFPLRACVNHQISFEDPGACDLTKSVSDSHVCQFDNCSNAWRHFGLTQQRKGSTLVFGRQGSSILTNSTYHRSSFTAQIIQHRISIMLHLRRSIQVQQKFLFIFKLIIDFGFLLLFVLLGFFVCLFVCSSSVMNTITKTSLRKEKVYFSLQVIVHHQRETEWEIKERTQK